MKNTFNVTTRNVEFCLALLIVSIAFPTSAATRIQIGAVPSMMKYDVTLFEARAGDALEVVFTNTCIMPHNLVLTAIGKGDAVMAESMAMGASGIEKDFVPDSVNILRATKLVQPGQSETLTLTVPATVGDYPYICTFPGHGILMRGVMRVKAAGQEIAVAARVETQANRAVDAFQWVTYNNRPLGTPNKPLVMHSFMPRNDVSDEVFAHHQRGYAANRYDPNLGRDVPGTVATYPAIASAIGVNFGEGFSYCWDTTECRLMYAWTGGFLDMEPYWGRGAGGSRKSFDYIPRIVGNVTFKTAGTHPLLGSATNAAPKYLGYRLEKNIPVFSYRMGAMTVQEKITGGSGEFLNVDYQVQNAPGRLVLQFDPTIKPSIQSKQGKWQDNQLILEGAEVREFALQIRRSISN